MGRRNFEQGNLSDSDVIACWLLSQDTGESFEKLIETRKSQVHKEIVKLAEDVRELGISKEDFERQGRIYLTAQEHGCSMRESEEYLTKLDEERTKEDTSSYGKIAKSLRVPKYGSPKENPEKIERAERPQKEVPQGEDVEWIPSSGTVSRYNEIKRKYRR